MWNNRTPLWWTLAGCAAIFSVTLTYPFNNDNALYAYMADLALHGRLPYLGSWDQNFPGIVAVHAIQILICGRSQLAFHIFDIALQLVGSALLYKIGERFYSARAGVVAALLCALYYVQQGLWMSGERDTYVTLFLLGALSLYCSGNSREAPIRTSRAIAIGLCTGIAILFRPTYALYALVFFVVALVRSEKDARIIFAGAAAPVLAFILWYWAIGGLRDFWNATILFNLNVYGGAGASFDLWEPVRFYWPAIFASAIACVYFWHANRQLLFLWAALFAASVASLLLLYRHSVYHYHPAMTLLILMSAVGWARVIEWTKRIKWTEWAVFAAIILFFGFQTFRGNTSQHVLVDIVSGRIHSLSNCYDRYESSPEFGVHVQTQVGQYLCTHTQPGDTVQMFGPYSYPQYFARLTTASRFQTLHALAMRGADDTLMPFQKRWRAEYLRDMQDNHPKYFIVCDAPDAFRQYYGGRLGHEILRDDFRELGLWLDSRYLSETKIGAFTLYRKRQ